LWWFRGVVDGVGCGFYIDGVSFTGGHGDQDRGVIWGKLFSNKQ